VGPLSTTGSQFLADRWNTYRGGYAAGLTVSRQLVSDSTNLPNLTYCIRLQRDSGNTGTTALGLAYNAESVDSKMLAGKTVTLSFYARAGATFISSGAQLRPAIITGTGENQAIRNGFTDLTFAADKFITLTNTWVRYSVSGNLGATITQFAVALDGTVSGTAGATDYFEITGVQLEVGSSATPFSRAGGDIQGELIKCQRYYYQTDSYATASYSAYNSGNFVSSAFAFPVTMRIAPAISVTDIPGNANRMTQYPLAGSAVANITPPSAVNIRTTHWFYEAGGTSNGSQGTGGAFAVRYIASAEL
jgi:hypothetical protein